MRLALHSGRPDQQAFAGFGVSLDERVERAIELLREHEPPEGYYLAFSGGKDSCVIKELAKMSGVKFEAWYGNTTIDAPELIWFLKHEHPDVQWHQPKHGNMFHRIATAPKVPPTRRVRWCCEEYKEHGGNGRVKVLGVRQEESSARRAWLEVSEDLQQNKAICPIVHWTQRDVWGFIRSRGIPYCQLYDEGWTRLGCVGCPLNNESRAREFLRWPRYAERWRFAVTENWRLWHGVARQDGEPRMQAWFRSAEDFWRWYIGDHHGPDVMRECQSGILWTNEDAE